MSVIPNRLHTRDRIVRHPDGSPSWIRVGDITLDSNHVSTQRSRAPTNAKSKASLSIRSSAGPTPGLTRRSVATVACRTMLETERRRDVWPFGNPKCPHCGNEARMIGGGGFYADYDCPTCKRRNRERQESEELRRRVARLESSHVSNVESDRRK